jgi:hypothetical protein
MKHASSATIGAMHDTLWGNYDEVTECWVLTPHMGGVPVVRYYNARFGMAKE